MGAEPDHSLADLSVTPVIVDQMKRTGTKKLFTLFTLRDCAFEHVAPFDQVRRQDRRCCFVNHSTMDDR
jgi:hypothetical protein